ncbi:hypothetical protein COHA_009005 [Chlorella ohadii]|uniref:Uncharacterized protein n=1 Tax=Chlorella ohadii TaxID=2649997 RepID=A0AAD5GYI9_9CHLO|nr:hypothetical protein COHA_009005 [Chlorella ohadii]
MRRRGALLALFCLLAGLAPQLSAAATSNVTVTVTYKHPFTGLPGAAGFSPRIKNFVWRLTNGALQPQIPEAQVQFVSAAQGNGVGCATVQAAWVASTVRIPFAQRADAEKVLANINVALANQLQTAQRWNLSMNGLAAWPCPSQPLGPNTITRSVHSVITPSPSPIFGPTPVPVPVPNPIPGLSPSPFFASPSPGLLLPPTGAPPPYAIGVPPTALPPEAQPPIAEPPLAPGPQPPEIPTCMAEPACRVFVASSLCCMDYGIVQHASVRLWVVCNADVYLPEPKCLTVTDRRSGLPIPPLNETNPDAFVSINTTVLVTPNARSREMLVDLPLAYFLPPNATAPGQLPMTLDFEQTRMAEADGLCSLVLRSPCQWEGSLYNAVGPVLPVNLTSVLSANETLEAWEAVGAYFGPGLARRPSSVVDPIGLSAPSGMSARMLIEANLTQVGADLPVPQVNETDLPPLTDVTAPVQGLQAEDVFISWRPVNTTSGLLCEMTNSADLPEAFLLGDFEELVGYEEDCTPASLPEVGGDLFDEQL